MPNMCADEINNTFYVHYKYMRDVIVINIIQIYLNVT